MTTEYERITNIVRSQIILFSCRRISDIGKHRHCELISED